MNKRKVYGVIFSLCLIIVSAAGISSIGFKKDIETKETEQNKTSESDEVASNTNTSAYSEEFVSDCVCTFLACIENTIKF